MIRTRTRGFIQSAVSATLLLAALGCSTDSPTAPRQDNSPNPPPDPRGSWGFTIEVEPPERTYTTWQPETRTVPVRHETSGCSPSPGRWAKRPAWWWRRDGSSRS